MSDYQVIILFVVLGILMFGALVHGIYESYSNHDVWPMLSSSLGFVCWMALGCALIFRSVLTVS